ncbi:MAG: hypothetical protein JRN20_09735 [Nitrososphaerota archaeon]|nr:hypothetical protein [Nitrososphaerota archaeon]
MLRKTTKILSSKNALVLLLLILMASSAAFTLTASVLFSLESAGSSILGESSGVVIVSQGNSRAPFTGALPISLVNNLQSIRGVLSVSPEVIAPSTVANKSVIVRGVDPREFELLESPAIISGRLISLNDTSGVMVGSALASELHMHVGSNIAIVGAIFPSFAFVQVVGIFHTGRSFDEEIVSPLWIGQWLRGFRYNVVSIFRVQVERGTSSSAIIEDLGRQVNFTNSPGNTTSILPYLPTTIAPADLKQLDLEVSQSTSSQFLSRALGLNQETIWLLACLVFFSMTMAVIFSFQEVVSASKQELETLRVLGMSGSRLRSSLMLFSIPFSVLSAVLGAILGVGLLEVVPSLRSLNLLFYTVNPVVYSWQAVIISLLLTLAEMLLASVYASAQFRTTVYDTVLQTTFPQDMGEFST